MVCCSTSRKSSAVKVEERDSESKLFSQQKNQQFVQDGA